MDKTISSKETYQTALEYMAMKYSQVTGQTNNSTGKSKTISEYIDGIVNFYDNLLACMPGNVYWWGKDRRCLGVNNNTANFMGVSREELVGKTYKDFEKIGKWPEGRAEAFEHDEKIAMETGKVIKNVDEDVPMPHPDGTYSYYYTNRVPLHNENNEIIGVVGISIDITERKKLEKELEEEKKNAEAYLQNAVEQIPGYISWKDYKGIYLGCNSRFAKRLGFDTPQEIIGKTDKELIGEDLSKEEKTFNTKILKQGIEEEIEEEKQLLDGKKCIYLTKKSPLYDKKFNIIGVISISFDVTERRLAEQQKSETLQSFGSIIAHEMRTPLASINAGLRGIALNIAELTDTQSLSGSKKRAYNNLNEILESIAFEIESSGLVIDMVLENIKASQSDQIPLKEISINQCIQEALNRYPLSDKHRGLLTFKMENDFSFLGEKHLFIHVLFNLIKNALYFIDSAGKGNITIWTEKSHTMNYLHFKDTGTGIEDDVLPNIFQKFYSRRYHGVGLGLAFCKQIMHKFGGDIVCKTIVREYTEFILSFPFFIENSCK